MDSDKVVTTLGPDLRLGFTVDDVRLSIAAQSQPFSRMAHAVCVIPVILVNCS